MFAWMESPKVIDDSNSKQVLLYGRHQEMDRLLAEQAIPPNTFYYILVTYSFEREHPFILEVKVGFSRDAETWHVLFSIEEFAELLNLDEEDEEDADDSTDELEDFSEKDEYSMYLEQGCAVLREMQQMLGAWEDSQVLLTTDLSSTDLRPLLTPLNRRERLNRALRTGRVRLFQDLTAENLSNATFD